MQNRYRIYWLLIFLLLSQLFPASNCFSKRKTSDISGKIIPGYFIVKFKPGVKIGLSTGKKISTLTQIPSIDSLNFYNKVIKIERAFRNISSPLNDMEPDLTKNYIFSVPLQADINQIINDYKNNVNVEYAEPIYNLRINHTTVTPDDPELAKQWGLVKIKALEAWEYSTGDPAVILAILDTGVDLDHPDLTANLWKNLDEIPANNIDDDGNGYVDDYGGVDFWNNDPYPSDDGGHGTWTAGIASAVTDNKRGVAGLGWKTRIMPLKIFDETGQ